MKSPKILGGKFQKLTRTAENTEEMPFISKSVVVIIKVSQMLPFSLVPKVTILEIKEVLSPLPKQSSLLSVCYPPQTNPDVFLDPTVDKAPGFMEHLL